MKNNIFKNLEELNGKIELTHEKKNEIGSFLLQRIEAQQNLKISRKISFGMRVMDKIVSVNFFAKPMAVFSAVLALFVVFSFTSVTAAKNTLPGDALYSVKITAESVQYNLTPSREKKTKVAMLLAEKRINELKEVTKNVNKKHVVAQASANVKKSLNVVKTNIQNVSEKEEAGKAVKTAKDVEEKLEKLAKETEAAAAETTEEAGKELAQLAEEMEEVSIVTLAVLIDKQDEVSDEEVPENELKEKVQEKYNNLQEKVETLKNQFIEGGEENTKDKKIRIDKITEAEVVLHEMATKLEEGDHKTVVENILAVKEIIAGDEKNTEDEQKTEEEKEQVEGAKDVNEKKEESGNEHEDVILEQENGEFGTTTEPVIDEEMKILMEDVNNVEEELEEKQEFGVGIMQ
jgi:hypothetical protein